MVIFQSTHKCLAILGIKCHQPSMKHGFNKQNLIFGIFGAASISHGLYLSKEPNFGEEYIITVHAATASILCTIDHVILVWKTLKLFEYIECLCDITQMRMKHRKLKPLYEKTNQQIEKNSKTINLVLKIWLLITFLPKFFTSFYAYFVMNSENDTFDLPFQAVLPFNTKIPMGYLLAFTMEFTAHWYMFKLLEAVLSLGIGSLLISLTLVKDAKRGLYSINKNAKSKQCDQSKALRKFVDFMDVWSISKRLVIDFSNIYQLLTFFCLLWTIAGICGALLVLQMGTDSGNLMLILMSLALLLTSLMLVFIPCEMGEQLSNAMMEINDSINRFDWYLFPIEIRKLLPIILHGVQQPVEVKCFGSIAFIRDTFKKVTKCAFSYFMGLRQFGK